MKKSEKNKLKNAFNIPEPMRKEQFISQYGDLIKKNDHKLRFPVVIRYSAYAAFAVLIIGVWGIMNVKPDFADKFNGDNIIESAVTTSAIISDNESHTTAAPISTDKALENINTATVSSLTVTTGKSSIKKTEITKKYTSAITKKNPASQTESAERTNIADAPAHTTGTMAASTTKIISDNTAVPHTTSCRTAPASTTQPINAPPAQGTDYNPPPAIVPQTTKTQTHNEPVTTTEEEQSFAPCPTEPIGSFAVPQVIYQKDENAEYIYDIFRVGGASGGSSTPPTADNTQHNAQAIVCAEIVDVIYTQFNNKPYTQLNLLVKYSLSGNIPDYSEISLYICGGYMPAAEYAELNGIEYTGGNETIIYDYGESSKIFDISDIGSEYIFLIGYDSGNLPENVYMTVTDNDKSVISPDDFHTNL